MKLDFDDPAWQRLQEDLTVGQVCGETAGKLYAQAKGAMQQAAAALVGQAEPTPEQAAHTLELLRALRNAAQDADRRYRAAVAIVDELARPLKPPTGKPRRRGSVA